MSDPFGASGTDLLTLGAFAAGISGFVSWLVRALGEQRFKERLARVEATLSTQSQVMTARFTRTDERRARVLSRLHTQLDRALYLTEHYVGSRHAGNSRESVDRLRSATIQAWRSFDAAFARAEIFLSAELADRIRVYGDAIADIRVALEQRTEDLGPGTPLEDILEVVSDVLGKLSRLKTDVRPQLVREMRSALGADLIDARNQ